VKGNRQTQLERHVEAGSWRRRWIDFNTREIVNGINATPDE
jgi:hypothetical protein